MSMAEALAKPDQPQETYQALETLVRDTVGVKLFTLMTLDHNAGLARRCYSNMPDAYPESGAKPMMDNHWSEQVIDRKEVFVANTIDDLAAVFADYELIQSLGCESCMNIPITVGGKVIGTINCLDAAGHYTPDRVALAESLKEPGALALLLAQSMKEAT